MLGVSVAISNPNVCETNVIVRLEIKENDLTDEQKKRDGIESGRTVAYNKYGFSNGHTLAQTYTQATPPMQRSTTARSRLNNYGGNNLNPEDSSPTGHTSLLHSEPPAQSDAMLVRKNMKERNYYDNSNLKLQTALKDSESQRQALACKLEETRSVLKKQNDKLRKIETAAIDNGFLMENLKFKEMEFRKAINHFEVSVKEKHLLQLRNLQLKEDIQERVDAIDFQLRNIKRQQLIKGRINTPFSDSTPFAVSALMEENTKLQQDNVALSRRVQEMVEEMRQLRSLLQIVKDENENLFAKCTAYAEDKIQARKQVEEYQNTVSDMKSRLSSVTAAQDQLLQDKFQASQKLQQMALDKEEIIKERDNIIKAVENSHSKAETERAHEENQKLQKELCILKHEYGLLSTKHEYFVNRYGEGGNEQKEKQEITKMRTERDDLLKQVSILHNQLSHAEDDKKQADDQLTRLNSELEEVKAELKRNAPGDDEAENSPKQQLEMIQKRTNDIQEYDLQQEQENVMKSRDEYGPHNNGPDTFHCKSLDLDLYSDSPGSTEPSKTQQKGHYGGCFFNMPEKSDNDENSRLQNLISKYGTEM